MYRSLWYDTLGKSRVVKHHNWFYCASAVSIIRIFSDDSQISMTSSTVSTLRNQERPTQPRRKGSMGIIPSVTSTATIHAHVTLHISIVGEKDLISQLQRKISSKITMKSCHMLFRTWLSLPSHPISPYARLPARARLPLLQQQ